LLVLTIADPLRGSTEDSGGGTPQPIVATFRGFARNVAYIGTVLGYAAYTFAVSGLAFWMPEYLERVRAVDLSSANLIVRGVTVVAGLGGTFVGGYVGDWLSARIKHGHLWISGLSSIAAIVPTWLALTVDSTPGYIVWLFVAKFLLFLSTGPVNVA